MEDVGGASVWDVVPGGDSVTPSTESINQSTGSKTQTSSVCWLTHLKYTKHTPQRRRASHLY